MLVRTWVAIIKTGKKSTVPVPLSLLQNQRWCWLAHNNGCCLTGLETWLTANWMTRVTCLGWRVSRRHLPEILHRRVSCDRFLRHLSGATVMQDLNISWDANQIRVLRVCWTSVSRLKPSLYLYLCLGGVIDRASFLPIFCHSTNLAKSWNLLSLRWFIQKTDKGQIAMAIKREKIRVIDLGLACNRG